MSTHDLTRRQLLEYAGLATMVALIPQPFSAASSPSNTNQDTTNATWFAQYQLRGSILVIKDNQVSASGFIAFGTDMTTIPTDPNTGTGVYQDYRGIYGLNAGTQEFYLQASDGKAYAGGGAVVLGSGGVSIVAAGSFAISRAYRIVTSGGVGITNLYALDTTDKTTYLSNTAPAGVDSSLQLFCENTGAGFDTYLAMYANDSDPTGRLIVLGVNGAAIAQANPSDFSFYKNVLFVNDNTNDIGASGTTRPRDLFLGRNIRAGGTLRVSGSTTALVQQNRITLANNATAQLSVGNAANIAFVVISCSSGDTGIFVTKGGANTASLISAGGGSFTATATTAGNTNVYWNTPTNTRYEIENKTGSSRNYDILEFAVG